MLVADGDLMDLTVAKLKDELKERGEKRTGNKAWLRRRLHWAMLHARLAEYRPPPPSSHVLPS